MNVITKYKYALITIALLIYRGFLNAFVPLMDKTEARYAEIARIMAETNNWVTPQIDYGVPFWAKPPLSTWLSAIAIKLFGENEFAVRLPSLLICAVIIFMIGKYAKRKNLPFFLPAIILITIPEFLIHTGVVSTDMTLTLSTTLIMIAFWESLYNNKKVNIYLVFIGIGMGLLAKGLIVSILTIPPIIIWLFITKNWKRLFSKYTFLTIFIGAIISLLIALPWYILAEIQTKGFIDYFIYGEHFKRFFDSDWKGDKYGFPKVQPLGIIWVFLVGFTLPWIILVIKKTATNITNILKDEWKLFLILWLLWTPVFFTFSKSLIHPYILPSTIPLALLAVSYWKSINKKLWLSLSFFFPLLSAVVLIVSLSKGFIKEYANTDKYLIENILENDKQVYNLFKKSYSSQFYTKGKVKSIIPDEILSQTHKEEEILLILRNKDLKYVEDIKNIKIVTKNKTSKKSLISITKPEQ